MQKLYEAEVFNRGKFDPSGPNPGQREKNSVNFLQLLFGCPTANFGAIIEAAASLTHVNHLRFTYSTQGSPGPA